LENKDVYLPSFVNAAIGLIATSINSMSCFRQQG